MNPVVVRHEDPHGPRVTNLRSGPEVAATPLDAHSGGAHPKSGDDDHEAEHLIEPIRDAGHDVSYHQSRKGWEASLDRALDLVVVAGGDGTVAQVARATATDRSP